MKYILAVMGAYLGFNLVFVIPSYIEIKEIKKEVMTERIILVSQPRYPDEANYKIVRLEGGTELDVAWWPREPVVLPRDCDLSAIKIPARCRGKQPIRLEADYLRNIINGE